MEKFSWTIGILMAVLLGASMYLLYLMSANQSSIYGNFDTLELQQEMDKRQKDLQITP